MSTAKIVRIIVHMLRKDRFRNSISRRLDFVEELEPALLSNSLTELLSRFGFVLGEFRAI